MQSKIVLTVLAGLVLLGGLVIGLPNGNPDKWLSDFEHLKSELAGGYANLEWAAEHNQLDLAKLASETEAKLAKASSERQARSIIKDFIASFNDPHLRAEKSDPPVNGPYSEEEWVGPSKTASAKQALKVLGYRKASYDFGIDFDKMDGFKRVASEDNPFPTAILPMKDGRIWGLIRIEYFGEDRYYAVAEAIWRDFSPKMTTDTCGTECWRDFRHQVRTRLMEYLQESVEALEASGVDAIAMDVTGNGGGTEWVEDVARLLTTKHLRGPSSVFVRHPHWVGPITEEIEALKADLLKSDRSPELNTLLRTSLEDHVVLLKEVMAGCPASSLWETSNARLACERLVQDPHGMNLVSSFEKEEVSSLSSNEVLFTVIRHPEKVGLYDGPLFVIVDGGSASATEQFATLLEMNSAATIVGEKTYGAGCGYTNDGIKVYLENTHLRIFMSDCMRGRADGENELAGIEPQIPGWKKGAKGKSRARQLVETLGRQNY
ncbi:MAG: S41 family peptidase [Bacteroidetes bacterium]|nr:S41 family peptidase [Bacteroidota bacterium]